MSQTAQDAPCGYRFLFLKLITCTVIGQNTHKVYAIFWQKNTHTKQKENNN